MLTSIEIEGFKSFGAPAQRIELSPLSFVVGRNASGKSNLINALRFLQNTVKQDAEFACNDLGGPDEVRNRIQRQRSKEKFLRIRVRFDNRFQYGQENHHSPESDAMESAPELSEFDYSICVDLRRDDQTPVIVEESMTCSVSQGKRGEKYELFRNESKVTISDTPGVARVSPRSFDVPPQERARPAIAAGFFSVPTALLRGLIGSWGFYSISPQIARQSYRETQEPLGPFGENLAVILRKLGTRNNGDGGLASVVSNLRGAVPGFESVEAVRTDIEGRWALKVTEEKIRGAISPSSVSDGTVRLLALMVIAELGRRRHSLIAIEEPENSIHPHVSQHIINVLRETVRSGQVIATTHNPAFLDFLVPGEILLCGKIDGLTKIRRACDIADVDRFRKHFALGELWVQGKLDFDETDDA